MASEPSRPELLGSGHWNGLVKPLDLSLRKLVLLCGDFCQGTYDAFNSDDHSKYCGSSRYGKKDFFHKVSFDHSQDFQVSEFLYATANVDVPGSFLLYSRSREAWSRESNWIGYVAVSSDSAAEATGRREIYVVWRGTIRDLEWINVLEGKQVSIANLIPKDKLKGDEDDDDDDNPKVMNGWHTIYTSNDPRSPFNKTSVRDQLWAELKELLGKYKDEEISIVFTGHSLGASLAILSSFDAVVNDVCRVEGKGDIPVCAVVFGCPQVGNKAFRLRLEQLPNLRVLHVKNELDLIPHYPSQLLGYNYVGDELVVDTRKSPYLKDSKSPSDWHNLQALLHVVAGWNGKDGKFDLKVKRSVALVNKSCDYLELKYSVPASWWVEKNKGLVKGADGEWELAPPDEEDVPTVPASQILE